MRKATNYIVVHCSATSAAQHFVDWKEIDRWHRQKGWLKIGYHYVITRDGVVQKGRDLSEVGAHVEGHNWESVGICLVGGVKEDKVTPEDNFTVPQKHALLLLLSDLRKLYPKAKIVGHNSLTPGKACPSFDLQKLLQTVPELTSL